MYNLLDYLFEYSHKVTIESKFMNLLCTFAVSNTKLYLNNTVIPNSKQAFNKYKKGKKQTQGLYTNKYIQYLDFVPMV